MRCHFLLQGIFPTQGSNLGLPRCRQTLYHLSHQGSASSLESSLFISPGSRDQVSGCGSSVPSLEQCSLHAFYVPQLHPPTLALCVLFPTTSPLLTPLQSLWPPACACWNTWSSLWAFHWLFPVPGMLFPNSSTLTPHLYHISLLNQAALFKQQINPYPHSC